MNFDKSAIEEANKHLLALNKRVLELEGTVTEQTEKLGNIEAEYQVFCIPEFLFYRQGTLHRFTDNYYYTHCFNRINYKALFVIKIQKFNSKMRGWNPHRLRYGG